MMQSEVLQSLLQQEFDQQGTYGLRMCSYECDEHEFYSSITTPEDSSVISSDSYFNSNLLSNLSPLPKCEAVMQVGFPTENIMSQNVGEIESLSATSLEDILGWWAEIEEMENISSDYSMEDEGAYETSFLNPTDVSMVLLAEDMEVGGQTSLFHLLKAYGEAMEMGQKELANVIVECIKEKANPLGGTIERVAFNLFPSESQVDNIRHESVKNFNTAFKAFYKIFLYGRFAHLAANSAILEAIMRDSGKVHIIDFDLAEGVQWSAMLGAIGKLGKEMKLTSIRKNVQSCSFKVIQTHLIDYAKASGLKLEVQERTMGELVREIEGSEEHEILAFNCMVGLPHMGRTRNRNEVIEFLMMAKQLLISKKGIITFGDGEDSERMKHCKGYGSFFNNCLMHSHALYESMEGMFPDHLTEARIAMESLFVSPHVSSFSSYQNWQNVKEEAAFSEKCGLTGCRLSCDCVTEAKELVNEIQSSYKIRIEGQNGNEMVLEWRGTPLVRVSAWK